MDKKDKDSALDDSEKLKNELIRDKVNEIFRNHPKDYITKMEELGFEYFEDDDDYEEIEERNAQAENQRQRGKRHNQSIFRQKLSNIGIHLIPKTWRFLVQEMPSILPLKNVCSYISY